MICVNCVAPKSLRKLFEKSHAIGECKYCGHKGAGMELRELFGYIYDRVRENVIRDIDLTDVEQGFIYFGKSDEILIGDVCNVLGDYFMLYNEPYFIDICAAVPAELQSDDRGESDTNYCCDNGTLTLNYYERRWRDFVKNVRHKRRYFNKSAEDFLDDAFSVLVNDDKQLKSDVIRTIPHGDLLFRARYAQDETSAKEIANNLDLQFGPAPESLTGNQRMTPNGVSALYCALDPNTCLSEIRSITGDHVVTVALTPISELKLLDLTVLDQVEPPALTPLDEGFRNSWHRKAFLDSLVDKMSLPKARNDELSYLSTQVVFEYLKLRFGEYMDGLVFPSVQTGRKGTNVVIFPEASRVSSTPIADPDSEDALSELPAKLRVLPDTLRFHKITSIETTSQVEKHFENLLTSDRNTKGWPWYS